MEGPALLTVGMEKVEFFYIFCGILSEGMCVSYIIVCYVCRMGGVLHNSLLCFPDGWCLGSRLLYNRIVLSLGEITISVQC